MKIFGNNRRICKIFALDSANRRISQIQNSQNLQIFSKNTKIFMLQFQILTSIFKDLR
ncbi:hypothetical protein ACWIUD_09770 [Helicobacter sp. 23-1044]